MSAPNCLDAHSILNHVMSLTHSRQYWVGFSGGMDSHVLLDLLVQGLKASTSTLTQSIKIGAIHVHHGLSPKADDWALHCQRIGTDLQVPVVVLKVNATPLGGESPEAFARKVRLQAWQDFIKPGEALLLAHHQNDQAETILLRLFRGAGPLGLGGMLPKSIVGTYECIRPLLNYDKHYLLNYAVSRGLQWIEDDSNMQERFDRNFLRHQILPHLVARWPQVLRSVSRSGALCLETATAIQALALDDLKTVQGLEKNSLSVKALLTLDPVHRKNVIRSWLDALGFLSPSRSHLERIVREILCAQSGAMPRLKIMNYEIRRLKDQLLAKKCEEWVSI